MRPVLEALVLLGVVAGCVPPDRGATAGGPASSEASKGSVDAARELDQLGVRSFRAGHYADAIAYFQAAYRMGAPSSELWNIVRSREGMDDAEGAAAAIDDYLAAPNVSAQDRADAQREAQALRSRASALTVTTNPAGATVLVDGKPVPGTTPVTSELRAGSHTIAIRRGGYAEETRSVDAKFGRAVILTLDLSHEVSR